MSIDRYQDVIPDWPGFLEAARRPEPTYLRVRAGRVSVGEVKEALERQGFVLSRVTGLEDFLRVDEGPYSPGQAFEHWLGLFYVQQAVTGVAGPALQPRAGERVLDACAAPGGKTTHLSDLMNETGTLVAVDVSEKRLRGLMGNVYRTGQLNVLAMSADARHLPKGVLFDRVLVDVPCTAEGNLRSRGGELPEPDPEFRDYISGVQEDILRRAVDLTRPGGILVYSTCTFAPEENEAVVSPLVEEGLVRVEPISLELPHAPGLTRFGERVFHPSLEEAWRLYPHHLDSGGLFLARLRRSEGAEEGPPSWISVPTVFPGDDAREDDAREKVEEGIGLLESRFGVSEADLRDLRWMVRGDSVWAHRGDEFPAGWDEAGDRRFLSLGIRALKEDRGGLRPTNDFLRRLDGHLTRQVLDLEPEECLEILRGGALDAGDLARGFVALRVEGRVVGRGLVGRSGVRSEVPKARARRLRDVLEIRYGLSEE